MGRVWLLALGAFAVGTDLFILGGILPELAASLRTSVAAAGQSVTVFAVVYAVAIPVIAASTAHFGPRRVLVAGMVVFTVANIATALSPNLPVLLIIRALATLGAAGYTPAAVGTAATLVPPARRGRALAVVMSGLNGAIALGVPVGTALAQAATWRAALVLVAVLGTAAALVIGLGLGALPAQGAVPLRARLAMLGNRRCWP